MRLTTDWLEVVQWPLTGLALDNGWIFVIDSTTPHRLQVCNGTTASLRRLRGPNDFTRLQPAYDL
jgi:hypothetical protein